MPSTLNGPGPQSLKKPADLLQTAVKYHQDGSLHFDPPSLKAFGIRYAMEYESIAKENVYP